MAKSCARNSASDSDDGLSHFLAEFDPAFEQAIVFDLRGFKFGQSLSQSSGLGGNCGILDAAFCCGEPFICSLDRGVNAIELALFNIGELLLCSLRSSLCWRACGRLWLCSDGRTLAPLLPLQIVGKDCSVPVTIESETLSVTRSSR